MTMICLFVLVRKFRWHIGLGINPMGGESVFEMRETEIATIVLGAGSEASNFVHNAQG